MYRYFKLIVLGAALVIPAAVAQDRDRPDGHHDDQRSRRYEDKTHNDFHEWNEGEDHAYRRFLQEHHKKYHDFAKAKKKEQNDYWGWRHGHPGDDRR